MHPFPLRGSPLWDAARGRAARTPARLRLAPQACGVAGYPCNPLTGAGERRDFPYRVLRERKPKGVYSQSHGYYIWSIILARRNQNFRQRCKDGIFRQKTLVFSVRKPALFSEETFFSSEETCAFQ